MNRLLDTASAAGRPDTTPWHIVGCGRMGTLAALYLRAAGYPVVVVRPGPWHTREVTLRFATDGHTEQLALTVRPAEACGPIARLVVACKTPYTALALAPIALTADALVLRLQNGIGSLDRHLAMDQRMIEIVTASAVKSDGPGRLEIVAENTTTFGGGESPAFWPRLAEHWPKAVWQPDIRHAQWRKLVVNAALNPVTALYDVPNGALVERTELADLMTRLADEADRLLRVRDPRWPGGSASHVAEIARATAANTSSMRADRQAGAVTEIDAINGWLLREGARLGIDLPTHAEIAARVRERHPTTHD